MGTYPHSSNATGCRTRQIRGSAAVARRCLTAAALVLVLMVTGAISSGRGATVTTTGQLSAAAILTAPADPVLDSPEDTPDTAPSDAKVLLDKVSPTLVAITADLESGTSSAGTGIVVSANGVVITNAHVIEQATSLSATNLTTDRHYRATLIGADLEHDIALVALDGASRLRTADLGDSETVRVGDKVVSIGNADGLGVASIGAGPVTGLHCTIGSTAQNDTYAEPMTGLIEARSTIRPGESGGPMVNTDGEVIGVNVAYETSPGTQQPSGYGYAIPINSAVRVAHQLLADRTE